MERPKDSSTELQMRSAVCARLAKARCRRDRKRGRRSHGRRWCKAGLQHSTTFLPLVLQWGLNCLFTYEIRSAPCLESCFVNKKCLPLRQSFRGPLQHSNATLRNLLKKDHPLFATAFFFSFSFSLSFWSCFVLPMQCTIPALCSLTQPFLFRGALQVLQVAVLGWTLSSPCISKACISPCRGNGPGGVD